MLDERIQLPLKKLKAMLDGVSLEFAIVDAIIPSKSGKYRCILKVLV
jgi:hypothetical protein